MKVRMGVVTHNFPASCEMTVLLARSVGATVPVLTKYLLLYLSTRP
jgi:hypothetical protein